MDAITTSTSLAPTSTIPYLDPSPEEHIMVYNISSALGFNASGNNSLYVQSLPGFSSDFHTTGFPANVTFEEVTMLTSFGRAPYSPRLLLLHKNVDEIVMPIALCVGILGSVLLVLIFMCTPLRASALSHYLTACGVSDLIYLLCCLAVWITGRGIQFHNNMGVCQVTMFALLLSRFLTTWYLLAAHAERVVVHFGSCRARKWCTTFRSNCIIIAIFVFSLVGFIHYIWIHVVQETNGRKTCTVMAESLQHLFVLSKIELITGLFLPMLLIVIIDIALCANVVANWGRTLCSSAKVQKKKDGQWRGEYALANGEISRSPSTRSGDSNPPPAEFDISKEKVRATVLVMIAGLMFIGLVLPSAVYRAKHAFSTGLRPPQTDMLNMLLSEEIVKFNSVYKIFLYPVMLKSFRHGLVHFFRRGCRQPKEEEPLQETSV